MEPVIIGLSGLAGCGKDTVASILSERGYERLAFADPIKEAVYKLNPVVVAEWEVGADYIPGDHLSVRDYVDAVGWDEAKKHPEVRRLLQVFGAEIGRECFGEYCWIDKTFRKIKDKHKYVITDCRYVNEADMVKRWGGQVWRINRSGLTVMDHSSEKSMGSYKFDREISNDGTLDELKAQVFRTLRSPLLVGSE